MPESKAGGEHVAERDQLLTFPFFPPVPIQKIVRQLSGPASAAMRGGASGLGRRLHVRDVSSGSGITQRA